MEVNINIVLFVIGLVMMVGSLAVSRFLENKENKLCKERDNLVCIWDNEGYENVDEFADIPFLNLGEPRFLDPIKHEQLSVMIEKTEKAGNLSAGICIAGMVAIALSSTVFLVSMCGIAVLLGLREYAAFH